MIFCHPWNIPDNFCYRNFLTWWNLILTPPGPPPGCPQGSEGDPEWIFVTLETYLTTFVSEAFWFDEIWFWHPQGPPIAPPAPRGQGVIPNAFLSSLKHTWQLLLATFFDLMKFEFEPLRGSPECPRAPRGRGSNSNSLFRAPMHEDLTLSIWFGYYKRFPRSFAGYTVTNKPKSTRKYLLDFTSNKNLHNFFCTFLIK